MNAQKGGQSAVKMFFRENKSLAFSLPILFTLLIVVVIIYYSLGSGNEQDAVAANAENPTEQAQTIEILPNKERTDPEKETLKASLPDSGKTGAPVVKNPFSGPMILTGVLTDPDGDNVAVIEANNKSYVVKKGDVLEDSITVEDITAGEVKLKNGDKEIVIKLEKRKNSQTVIN